MPIVRLKENEPFEAALRRFKRTIEKTGLLTELRSREFYEKPTAERKRKRAAAVKRHYKRIRSQQLPPRLYQFITITRGTLDGRVLLVDDMVDTGLTFTRVRDHLVRQFPGITELRTAVLWQKGHAQVQPDYHVEHLPTNPWIHQPFEDYDSLRPHQLESWIRKGVRTAYPDSE